MFDSSLSLPVHFKIIIFYSLKKKNNKKQQQQQQLKTYAWKISDGPVDQTEVARVLTSKQVKILVP